MIKKLSKNLTLLYILFIFIGFCSLDFYYKEFGIEIVNYLNLSEILILFLPNVNQFSMYVLFSIFYYGIIILAPEVAVRIRNKGKNRQETVNFVTISLSLLIFVVFSGLYILKNFILKSDFELLHSHGKMFGTYWTSNSFIFIFILSSIFMFINVFYKKGKFDNSKNIYEIIVTLLVIVAFIYVIQDSSRSRALKTKTGVINNHIEFTYNSQTFNSDSLNMFIGETHEYLFIYKMKENKTKVLRKNDVKDLTFFKN